MRYATVVLVLAYGLPFLAPPAAAESDCDQQKSSSVRAELEKQVNEIQCDRLKQTLLGVDLGVDKEDHRVMNVCYQPGSDVDRVRLHVQFACKTSDAAVFSQRIDEKVTATIRVNKSDCTITESDVDAAGEIGRILVESAEFFNAFRKPLQEAVSQSC